ncbi:MAG: AbrB family transcriptional regulator [Hoeflea sp.]|uniref:AbrB family transcriptional regulator n=1 Tax=Hoeflea sp. TaxID=1940281 RepID=UPI002730F010|nr:AbrB family transcriptional regulator [Hoeflea sp.]MDP2118787.1 AbrB family transcriptional regulator [Hoeflea sp.]MDZ7601943.1 AbrB family transcriptional regulator [Hoeflea sp.]
MATGSWQIPLLTFGIAILGAGATYALGFPAPFLTGPAMAVTLAGLVGLRTAAPPQRARDAVFVILGLTIGQGVTPDVFDAMRAWPVTLAALAASLFAIIFLTRAALMRFWAMDPLTAFLSSSPGHLSYVLGLSEGVKADLKTVSIVQSIRVLALTLLVPVAVTVTGQIPEKAAVGPAETELVPLVAMILVAGVAGYLLQRLKLPAAYLIGGMLVSIVAHVTGLVGGVMSFWLAAAAFVALGGLIGSRFSGVTWPELRRAFSAGIMVTVLGVILAGGFGLVAHWITGMDLMVILIAFAPGGLETMAAMAVILGIDPTFVASHHVARLLMLTAIVPVFLLAGRRD